MRRCDAGRHRHRHRLLLHHLHHRSLPPPPPSPPQAAETLNSLGALRQKQKRYEESEGHYERSLALRQQLDESTTDHRTEKSKALAQVLGPSLDLTHTTTRRGSHIPPHMSPPA